jgi:hypothetical protein
MKTNNYENACETLARTAWLLSGYIDGGTDIVTLACKIADQTGGEHQGISDDVLAGLESLAAEDGEYTEGPDVEFSCMGHVRLGDTDCYWWANGAETIWSCDRPDWWDDQLAQWQDAE